MRIGRRTAAAQHPSPAISVHDDIALLTATALRACYLRRELSPVEVVEALAARIDAVDRDLHAVTACPIDAALVAARASEARYASGEVLPLDGIPIGVKDLIDTVGVPTSCGSRIFATRVPAVDAPVVARLRQSGALITAKTATHEFAWGVTTESPLHGTTRNPWAPDRVAGGSSGGSAAAVAAGFVPLAIGTDTAGSIRIPAGFCGVVGLRPTHGTVDATGVFPLAPSLDTVGPMARTVADVALLADVIAQPPRSAPPRPARDVSGLVVAVCPHLDQVELAAAVESAVSHAAATLAGLGAWIVEARVPQVIPLFSTLGTVVMAEGHHVHSRNGLWPRHRADYGADVRSRLERAQGVALGDYLDAQNARLRLAAALRGVFRQADVLLSPVSAAGAIPIDAAPAELVSFREHVMTPAAPQSLAGLPACVVRAGFDGHGVPVGVQLTGQPGSDGELLALAGQYEAATAAAAA